jgi:hypothetical protein
MSWILSPQISARRVIPYQRLSSGPIDSPLREQKTLGAAPLGKPKKGRASPGLLLFLLHRVATSYLSAPGAQEGLLGTRRATSAAIDAFAGNMGVVREEFGPTDAGCSPGAPPDRGLEPGCSGYPQVPAPRLCGTGGGLASSNIPDPFDRQRRRDSLGMGD